LNMGEEKIEGQPVSGKEFKKQQKSAKGKGISKKSSEGDRPKKKS